MLGGMVSRHVCCADAVPIPITVVRQTTAMVINIDFKTESFRIERSKNRFGVANFYRTKVIRLVSLTPSASIL